MIFTLLATIVVVFTLMEFVPGDPARAILGEHATDEAVAAIHEKLGLDDPYLVRLGRYIVNLCQGDMGTSYRTGRPVSEELMARFPGNAAHYHFCRGCRYTIGNSGGSRISSQTVFIV